MTHNKTQLGVRRIPSFPGYEVTNKGDIYSLTKWRGFTSRKMIQTPNADGYPSVRIIVDGKRKRISTHRLVAAAFLQERPSPQHEICHKDGNKLNNEVSNLRWGTRKDNANDREHHGRTSRGDSHSVAIKAAIAKARGQQ